MLFQSRHTLAHLTHHPAPSEAAGEAAERGKFALQKGPSPISSGQRVLLTQSCLTHYLGKNTFPLWIQILSCSAPLGFPWKLMSRVSLWQFHLLLHEQSKKDVAKECWVCQFPVCSTVTDRSSPPSWTGPQYARRWPGEQSAPLALPRRWFGNVPGAWPCRAGARVHSQLSAAVWEQSPGHRPCRLDTFLQLLSQAKSQESTCSFTYSCQGGKNRLNPGCSHWLPIPGCCQRLSRGLTQH